jgi:hypothetical protein
VSAWNIVINFKRRTRKLKVAWNPARKLYEPVLLEEHVLKEIVTRLWLQAKIRTIRINQPVGGKVRQNEAGIPDLVGWISKTSVKQGTGEDQEAIPLFIEVKRPGGARRPAQIRFIAEAKEAGCVAFFAESWFDVIRELYPFGVKLAA